MNEPDTQAHEALADAYWYRHHGARLMAPATSPEERFAIYCESLRTFPQRRYAWAYWESLRQHPVDRRPVPSSGVTRGMAYAIRKLLDWLAAGSPLQDDERLA